MVALTLKEKYELKKLQEAPSTGGRIAAATGAAAAGGLAGLAAANAGAVGSAIGTAASAVGGALGTAGAGVVSLVGVPFLAGALGAGALGIMAYNKISREDLKRSEEKWNASIKALEKLNQIQIPDSLPALKEVITNFDKKISALLATERSAINKLLFGKGDDSDKSKTWKTAWGLIKTDAGKMSDTVKQIEEFDSKLQKLYAQIAQVIKAYGGEGKADKTIRQILDRE